MSRTVFQYGRKRYSVTFFSEAKKIPEHILDLVKKTYLLCQVISAKMIETYFGSRRHVIYLVQLEDDEWVSFVKISEERVELIRRFSK